MKASHFGRLFFSRFVIIALDLFHNIGKCMIEFNELFITLLSLMILIANIFIEQNIFILLQA